MSDAAHLAGYLLEAAGRFPKRPAVREPGGRTVTYGELAERATSVAGFLTERGVRPGDRVGILLPKSVDAVTAVFGTLMAGAAYVPADWTAPPARSRLIYTDCAIRALILDPRCREILSLWPEFRPEVVIEVPPPNSDAPSGDAATWDDVLAAAGLPQAAATPPPDALAYILYTSGSTGRPKGVTLTHRNATSFVDWSSETFTPSAEDRFSSHAPFHFDLSIFDLYVSLKHGATLCLIPDDLGKSPKELAQYVADEQITVWYSTPSVLSLLAQHGGLDRLAYVGPRLALFAGEVFPVKHLRTISRLWHGARWYNLYGPTETNVCTFAGIPTPVPDDRTEPYPIGELCRHCEGLVLAEDGCEAAPGAEGLLHVAGPSVFRGYWNRPDRDAEAFVTIGGRRWYNTGDVVRRDPHDGLVYVGRRDRMVKRRGYRIELGEIESALYRNGRIRATAVVSVPDAEQGVRIVACLVADAPRPSIIELKQYCAAVLPAYMSPDVFLFLDELPRTSTDKTDYQALLGRLSPPR